ncbi:helix-turn-helix domain-containing protein [Nonomuraea jiangxiensis]|uniref:Helix-turn-helix domain-containing protein n=1 Tax=Nonomuraea jiangxiensis TaxID=633440 RepID=A0A1G8JI03_9ACTN|nr:helix-turn-helix domain-containing protein [Nonomuraea jiangxiensis]SDI30270.1 Helix-turn-helix domain-containing protein [Nonomuraea jiangxiensis]
MDALELFAHPVRLRIVHAMAGNQIFTTSRLCELIPDVSKATVYRHVGVLADAGVLEVEGEERVRGAVERRYRLRRDRATVDAEMVASLSPEDHRRVFAAAIATLLAEFNAYLDRDHADPVADAVGYRQHALWLSQDERDDLIAGLRAAILPHLGHEPAPHRRRHLLSPILFPNEDAKDSGPVTGESGG